jgi:hypoxanthine phosphoribosyltransferase
MIATQGQTKMSDKVFLTADQLLRDSYDLAAKVLDSGFRPTFILGVWRGGTPVGIAVQELLSYCGLKSDHISIRTSSYRGIDDRSSKVRVYGLNYVVKNINRSDSLLIVDDVHDTGLSIKELIKQIKKQCRKNTPREIRFATVYYKPERSKVKFEPDYFIHETDDWLVFPHELEGLSREELIKHKPGIDSVLDRLLTHTD